MSSGNHLADQADAEREKKGLCPDCKVLLTEIDWCSEHGYECSTRCDNNIPGELKCGDALMRLKCPRCGALFPIE